MMDETTIMFPFEQLQTTIYQKNRTKVCSEWFVFGSRCVCECVCVCSVCVPGVCPERCVCVSGVNRSSTGRTVLTLSRVGAAALAGGVASPREQRGRREPLGMEP